MILLTFLGSRHGHMNLLTHFMLQSNLPNKQITAVSCCLVSLWKGTNPSNKRRIDDKNDCTLRVKAAEDIMKGKKKGCLRENEKEKRESSSKSSIVINPRNSR